MFETVLAPLRRLDLFIIDRIFQPVADWLLVEYGKDLIWMARVAAWIGIALNTAVILFVLHSPNFGEGFVLKAAFMVIPLFMAVILLRLVSIMEKASTGQMEPPEDLDDSDLEDPDDSGQNPARISSQNTRIRLFWLTVVTLALGIAKARLFVEHYEAWYVFAAMEGSFYLLFCVMACDDRPPAEDEVEEEVPDDASAQPA